MRGDPPIFNRNGWLRDNRKWYGVGISILALAAVTTGLWGAQWITPRERELDHPAIPDKSLSVWVVVGPSDAGDDRRHELLSRNRSTIDAVVPNWYTLAVDGKLEGGTDNTLQRLAQELRIPLQPLVRVAVPDKAVSAGKDLFYSPMAPDQERVMKDVVDRLLEVAETPGVSGLHLDLGAITSSDQSQDGMLSFLRHLSERLGEREQELILHVDPVHDRTDLSALVDLADAIHVAGFRIYQPGDTPGPVAPLAWSRAAVDQTLNEVQHSQRVILGLAAFGYDWAVDHDNGQEPETIPLVRAQKLQESAGGGAVQRTETEVPFFRYQAEQEDHVVWYEDGMAIRPKMQYARELNLRGVMIWNLEFTDDSYWQSVAAHQSE